MEKIMTEKLVWFLEQCQILSALQDGFTKKESTNTAMLQFTNLYYDELIHYTKCIGVFKDFRAFE